MAEVVKLHHPWLVAAWPGMGGVALNAGYYLLSKLDMHLTAEYEARNLFDVEHVEVKDGIIQAGHRPRNRFFVWQDPKKGHDIVVFLGEAQPPLGKYLLCQKIFEYARELGVERVFTFAAMATEMHPEHRSRVFGAATDSQRLAELKQLELEIMKDGHIGGLNGVLLGMAAENGLPGTCLLGEMPHIFSQLPFPKGSQAILEVFTRIAGIDLDFTELAEQARIMEQHLGELLARVEQAYGTERALDGGEVAETPAEEERMSAVVRERIETLFAEAEKDRARAFELKRELDRLGVFKEYEDRFLDLFKKSS
jgi:proteasome assembly chaperone (PAC2) family protein